MATLLSAIDEAVGALLSQWDSYTTLIALALAALVAHTILTAEEPDVHPFILRRQSTASRVRREGESAVYRASDVPEGVPLRSGLNVKRPTDPMYTAGRDGDVRDIWSKIVGRRGEVEAGSKQKILTVFGREHITEHDIDELTNEIAVAGKHLMKSGCRRVAVYLPNSVEFLGTLFACSFFGLSIILIPFNQPHALVVEILKSTKADSLVAAAGSLPLEFVTEGYPSLKHLIWVVEKTSRHMDWTEVPEGLGGSIDVTVWHELVHDADLPSAALPDLSSALGDITTIWQTEPGRAGEIVTFTHGNLVAAIAGLTYSLPRSERLGPADLFLPADALTTTYTLALTLSALWTGASVALNSVAGPEVDLRLAAAVLSPTVVAASAGSAAKLHAEAKATAAAGGLLAPLAARAQRSALAAGNMPRRGGVLASLGAVGSTATVGGVPGALRLVLVASRAGCGDAEPPVGEADLCDLRAATGARVVYALTAAKVAGAVAQTHAFDYRVAEGARGAARGHSHFGAPVGSVEVKLVDAGEHRTTDACARGEIVVSGPAVQRGQTSLGVPGTIRDDFTLAYI